MYRPACFPHEPNRARPTQSFVKSSIQPVRQLHAHPRSQYLEQPPTPLDDNDADTASFQPNHFHNPEIDIKNDTNLAPNQKQSDHHSSLTTGPGSGENALLRLQRQERLLVVARDDTAARQSLQVLQALRAPEPAK